MNFKLYPGEDGAIIAQCLDLPGCTSQGKDYEEALENIKEAAAQYLKSLIEGPTYPLYTTWAELELRQLLSQD